MNRLRIEERSISYGVFLLAMTPAFFWFFIQMQGLPDSACYTAATRTDPATALEEMEAQRPICTDREPFNLVETALTEETETSESPAEDDGLTATSAETWRLVWVSLLALGIGAGVGGAAMSIYEASRLTTPGHFAWSLMFAAVGLGVLLLVLREGARIEVTTYGALYGRSIDGLVAWALLPPVVTVTTIVAIGHTIAHTDEPPIERILEARTVTNLLTSALGLSLTAGVLATGARWQMIGHLPGAEPIPAIATILYGATFTAVITALYVPTQTRLNRAVSHWIATTVDRSSAAAGKIATTPMAVYRRKALREDLAYSDSRFGAFSTIISVVAPIATAAASSILF